MSDFNTSIIEEFRANGGRVGGEFEGSPLILIHHFGAKSGAERVTPLGCFPQSDGRPVIVASNGGAAKHPNWYYNLKANPEVRDEFGTEIFGAEARELERSDRRKVWADAVRAVPILVSTSGRPHGRFLSWCLPESPDAHRRCCPRPDNLNR
jgi:deazaflavin-dependent oxidoreductase (nitroreductase family)